MKVTVSDRLALKLKAILADRPDPDMKALVDQMDRGLGKNQNLDLAELAALAAAAKRDVGMLADADDQHPAHPAAQGMIEILQSAIRKLDVMAAKIRDGYGATG